MGQALKILIVDDEIEHFENLEDFIEEKFECSCTYATDGLMALRKIQNQQFDLLILDNMMPKMKGVEAIEHIRKQKGYKNTPILILSGSLEMSDVKDSMGHGIKHIIVKPVNFETLLAKIEEVLNDCYGNNFVKRYLRDVL